MGGIRTTSPDDEGSQNKQREKQKDGHFAGGLLFLSWGTLTNADSRIIPPAL